MPGPEPPVLYKPFEHTACICANVKYQYGKLNANEIRVLVIEPAQPEEGIRCRMIQCNLKDQPFEALSYTWGNETVREVIQCTDKPCCIPANCALAIRKLRYPDRERFVWIDAICIDQQNTAERGAQVQAMSKIYYAASRTVIYLGERADDSDLAMDYVSSSGHDPADERTTAAIYKLYQRPYFERIWVIQEVSMSRSALAICGARSLPWFYLVAYAIKLPWQPPVLSPMARLHRRDFMHFTTTDEFVRSLCEATLCKCRDPRDRIFAFMSMLPTHMNADEIRILKTSGFPSGPSPDPIVSEVLDKVARFDPANNDGSNGTIEVLDYHADRRRKDLEQLGRLPVNYKSPVEVVFTNAATVLLHRVGLDFLSAMQGHKATVEMPTWVPDWRVPIQRTILAHIPLSGFSAGGHLRHQHFSITDAPDHSQRSLVLSARRVSMIRHLGEMCDTTTSDWQTVVLQNWRALAETNWRGAPHDLHNSFLKAIFMDASEKFAGPRRMLHQRLAVRSSRSENDQSLFSGLTSSAVHRLRTVLHGRHLFITETNVLGLTSSESEVGDLIFVVLGTKVPYVFRKRGRVFGLIGECYAQGYMKEQNSSHLYAESICVI